MPTGPKGRKRPADVIGHIKAEHRMARSHIRISFKCTRNSG
ncbi:hypothetical protein [Mesorhizobium tamadayense]|nr:hypothetical protein [Mesorhizobium tamadayense]